MSGEVWMQCQHCGKLHQQKIQYNIEEDFYIKVWCPGCRDDTSHLICSEYEDEIYFYYNANLDERFYKY
jgi:phage FluMu protein Com